VSKSEKINELIIDWHNLGENMKKLKGWYIDYEQNTGALLNLALELEISVLISSGFGAVTTDAYEYFEPHGKNENDGYFCIGFDDLDYKDALLECVINKLEYELK